MDCDLREQTLNAMIAQATSRYAMRRALVYEGSTMTYRQLGRNAEDLAKGLIQLGIRRGDKVGIWMVDNPAWIYSYFGIAMVGGIIVPINARYRSHDVKHILEHAEIRALIISDLRPEIQDYVRMIYEVDPEIRKAKGNEIRIDSLPRLRNIIVVGPREHDGTLRMDHVLETGRKNVDDRELRERQKEVRKEDIVAFQYTSGTTSFPKGCILTHEIVVRNALACALRLEIRAEQDIFCDVMPPFHVLGICFGVLPAIAYGCCRIGIDHFDPLEIFSWIEKERCTVHSGMGDMIKAERYHREFNRYDLSSLRTGFCGDLLSVFAQVDKVLPEWKLISLYGLSEIGGNLATTRRDDPVEVRMQAHGRPHDGLEVKIVDPETNLEFPNGVEGEICARGWSIMKGYFKDPEMTARTIDRDGWLHTGDKGFLDDSGLIHWAGRIKDTIKVRGENVAPKEVESFIIQHPKVQHVEVVGVTDEKYNEVVGACIELKKGTRCTEEEIIDFCMGKIASFKIPKHVRFVESWPRSATKIQKFKLRELLEKELDQLSGQ